MTDSPSCGFGMGLQSQAGGISLGLFWGRLDVCGGCGCKAVGLGGFWLVMTRMI